MTILNNIENELLRFKNKIKFATYTTRSPNAKRVRTLDFYYSSNKPIVATDVYLICNHQNQLVLAITDITNRNIGLSQDRINLLKSTIYELNFNIISKPAFVYDYSLNVFALINSNSISILNFGNNLQNLTENQIKLQVLSSLIVRLRYFKLDFKLMAILVRVCPNLIKEKLLNPDFKIDSSSIIKEFKNKKLIIHNINISNNNISLFSKIKFKNESESTSALTLAINKVYGNLRIMIKKNVIFNNFKINDDFITRRFPEIFQKKANELLESDSIFNNIKLKTLESFYNILYLLPVNTDTIHRIIIRSDSDMTLALAFINAIENYNKIESSIKLLSIASYLELYFKFKTDQLCNTPFSLDIGPLKLKQFPHDGHYLAHQRYGNFKNSPNSFEMIANITKLNPINTITFSNFNEINFKLIALVIINFKNYEKLINSIRDFVDTKQLELLNKL